MNSDVFIVISPVVYRLYFTDKLFSYNFICLCYLVLFLSFLDNIQSYLEKNGITELRWRREFILIPVDITQVSID